MLMQPSIILVAGYAASGKTRVGQELARRLSPCVYLDKDTLSGPIVDRLLVALGSVHGDRDSEIYQCEVRPLEYACLMAAGFEAAELGTSAILCAPFLQQFTDRQWMEWLKEETRSRAIKSQIIWIYCDRAPLLTRMIARDSPRDQEKVKNWRSYSASVDEVFHQRIPAEHLLFDNSDAISFDKELDRIVRRLNKTSD
jgi:predicted kinase